MILPIGIVEKILKLKFDDDFYKDTFGIVIDTVFVFKDYADADDEQQPLYQSVIKHLPFINRQSSAQYGLPYTRQRAYKDYLESLDCWDGGKTF